MIKALSEQQIADLKAGREWAWRCRPSLMVTRVQSWKTASGQIDTGVHGEREMVILFCIYRDGDAFLGQTEGPRGRRSAGSLLQALRRVKKTRLSRAKFLAL